MENYKKNRGLLVAILLVLFTTDGVFAGGPWTAKKGNSYIKLSEWWLVFDQHYTDVGLVDPNITTGIFNTFIYTEYGITDKFTAILNGALLSRNYMNNVRSIATNEIIIKGEAINTIGDFDVGLKYGLTKPGANIPMAIGFILGLPIGATGKGTLGALQTGDGEFNQMIQFDIGKGFQIKKQPAYFSIYTAFNNRTNGYSEEFRYGAEVGVGLLSGKLWLSSKLNGIKSFKNGETIETVTSTSIFANNSEFTSIAFEANYLITQKFGLSVNYATAVSGKIIAAAPSYNVGVFFPRLPVG